MGIENNQNYVRSIFLKKGEKLKFKMGQSISDDKYLSGSVYFIEEGSARIIYNAIKQKKEIIYINFFWRVIMFFISLIPEKIFKRLSF